MNTGLAVFINEGMERSNVVKTECDLIKAALFGTAPEFCVGTDWEAVFAEMRTQTVFGLPYGWLLTHEIPDQELRSRRLAEKNAG